MTKLVPAFAMVGAAIVMAILYPYAIYVFFARSATPAAWNANLYSLTNMELREKLGAPDADFSAKEFIAWVDEH